MRCKIVVGRKTLIPFQNVDPEVSDMIFGLIKARHPEAKRVLAG